jgi:polar amino acid transport system substrate-binding protein
VGTTSLIIVEDIVQPNAETKVTTTSAPASSLRTQIDGLVVDTPTAFYIRDAELENFDTPDPEGAVIGQIMTDSEEYFGIVLDKDSPLTACVNEALAAVKASGRYQEIYDTWISDANDAPDLQ